MRRLDHIQKKLSKVELRDEKSIQGYVKVKVNGLPYWEGPNLVMNEGLAYAAGLLGGFAAVLSPTTYAAVDTILIGNGGCDPVPALAGLPGMVAHPTVPEPPRRTDATNSLPVAQSLNSQITTPLTLGTAGAVQAANTVIFQESFQADLLSNGDFPEFGTLGATALFINEFGLYVSAAVPTPQLLARVTVPSIAFAPTSGWTIAVEWTVGYL